jgi:hypothetical protein
MPHQEVEAKGKGEVHQAVLEQKGKEEVKQPMLVLAMM